MAGAVSIASPVPVRTPEGGATDWPFQPLADCGNGNPAFYHQYFDDFDQAFSFSTGNTYTISGGGTGPAFTGVAGVGGQGQLTIGSVASHSVWAYLVKASFTENIAPKKLFFETRLVASSNPATSIFEFGLANTAAPLTDATGANAVTDGIFFRYVGSTNTLTLSQAVGGVLTTVTVPTAAYSITATAPTDFAFYQNRLGDILVYVDTQLVGYLQQSQLNTLNNPQNAGAVARILGTSYTATAVVLGPFISMFSSTASATSNWDFITVEQER